MLGTRQGPRVMTTARLAESVTTLIGALGSLQSYLGDVALREVTVIEIATRLASIGRGRGLRTKLCIVTIVGEK